MHIKQRIYYPEFRDENEPKNLRIGEELVEKRAKAEREGRSEIRNSVHTPPA